MQTVILILILLFTSQDSSIDTSINQNENFEEFFQKFSKDSIFQISRTQFPLKITQVDILDEKTVITLEKSDWVHLDFTDTVGIEPKSIDAYEQKAVLNGEEIHIQLRGIDNGIRIDYVFRRIEKKWILVAWNDFSS